MTKILFLYNNLLDLATLTASSANADFPVANLKNPFRTVPWRTAGNPTAGTANLVINHGSAKLVNCVALIGYNWAAAPGTLAFEAHTADAWGAPDFSQALTWAANPTVNGNPGIIIKTFADQTKQYNRLNVVYSPGGVPTDWDLGRIFVGAYFEPTSHYQLEYILTMVDPSLVGKTIGGQKHVDELPQYRELGFDCWARSQAQWELFQKMINTVGIHKSLIIAFDYDNEPDEMTIYGDFTSLPRMAKRHLTFPLPFQFEEAR